MSKRLTTLEVRKSNRNGIMRILHKNSPMSKQEIAQQLNLSMPTITQNLKELEAQGLIEYKGCYESTGGRKAKKVSFVFNAKLAIGVEISWNYMRFVAIDLRAGVIAEEKADMQFHNIDFYKEILSSGLADFINKNNLDTQKLLGIGITIPGTFFKTGDVTIIEQSPSLKLKSVIAEDLTKSVTYNCTFINDADAAGFAELWHDENLKSCVYMLIKNGIGGSVFLNNGPFEGHNHRAGEIGHMTLVRNGELCACGKNGCYEAYIRPERLMEKHNCSLPEFFENVDKGIKAYTDTFNEYMDCLAIGINNIRMIFDCDILIGGEINEYLETYTDLLKNLVEDKNSFYDNADFLKFGHFKSNGAAIGAALIHVEKYLSCI